MVWMKIGAVHRPRHVTGQGKDRRVIAARLVKPCYQMRAARTGRARTDTEPSGELCLPRRGQCRAFFVPDADPFDSASANGIRKRIEGIANQTENA